MTIDIEAIRERAEKATPGPWRQNAARSRDYLDTVHVWGVGGTADEVALIGRSTLDQQNDDSDFIAHARTDIPALVTALEERDARIAELREALQNLHREANLFAGHKPRVAIELKAARAALAKVTP